MASLTGRRFGFRLLMAIACSIFSVACGYPESGGPRGLAPLDFDGSSGGDALPPGDAADAGIDTLDPDAGPDVDLPTCAETACHALATCDDSSGGAVCTCLPGYEGDGTTSCVNIDECATATDDCAVNATCTDTDGSFTCACTQGFTGDGKTCADLDECADTLANDCHDNADCQNTVGGFTCACKAGFEGDGINCADVDECAAGTDDCPAGTNCRNTAGSFACDCAAGFELSGGKCVNKCVVAKAERCDPLATCAIVANEAECSCPSTHTDVNGDGSQCVVNQSCTGKCTDPHAICVVDSPTAVHCECPPDRYVDVNGDGSVCQDVNECTANTDGCSPNATCVNTVGGFTCQCKSGFSGNGITCMNIDECANGTDTCDPNATCTDRTPGFTCACKAGWTGNGQTCSDVNECTVGTDNCHQNANCMNTAGSYTCACKPGFTGNGTTTCNDVNECTAGTDNCHANATCANTPGSYTCTCNPGYTGNGTTSCTNANECALGTDDCDANATCTDRPPPQRWQCACKLGYSGTGQTCTFQFCDLTGTWAVRTRTSITWNDVRANVFPNPVVIQAGSFTGDVWELRQVTYDGTTVSNQTKPCGATYPDAKNPFLNETYGAYIPNTRWDSLPWHASFTDPVAQAGPGDAYVSSLRAELFGIKLADPFGAWPALASDVPALCETPGASPPCWSNDDQDNFTAISTWSKPPTQTSPIYSQAYSYAPAGPQVSITKRVGCQHLAARTITRLNGTVVNCNQIKGPMEVTETNSRLHSCRLAPNHGNEVDCFTNRDLVTGATLPPCATDDAAELDAALEDLDPTVTEASFAMVRVAANATCATVRGTSFPPVP